MTRRRKLIKYVEPESAALLGTHALGQVRVSRDAAGGEWSWSLYLRPGLSLDEQHDLAAVAGDAIGDLVVSGFDGSALGWTRSDYEPDAWYVTVAKRPIEAPV